MVVDELNKRAHEAKITGEEAKAGSLQLAVGGSRKVNFGVAEAEYGGASIEATKTITHELGATPLYADISPEDAGYVTGTAEYGATTFKAKVQKRDGSTPGAGTKAKFHWVAIG
jgi:hypothetical protein